VPSSVARSSGRRPTAKETDLRVPLSWLREYVDFDWTPEELASRLTALGMEVSSIDRIGDDWTQRGGRRVAVGRKAP
jgi:hypothetical protein